MDKGYPPQESAPPYPGPPLNYGPPQPQVFPQPGGYPHPSLYPPPPGGYQPVTHVIVSQSLRHAPGLAVCPNCRQSVTTKTEYVTGLLTWLSCVGLCFFGCHLCCCIPFCINSCKDVEHRCPDCNQLIDLYRQK